MTNDHLDLQSPDLVAQNIDKIAALFPNCVTEGPDGKVIDFDLLRQELSPHVVEGTKERYRLEWPGKREAIVTANLPTTKTLRPVREDSVDFDNTENLYIEGDNLEVLKLLQESYLGKIKMIYIDPPYNTGKDFVYKDNFTKDTQEELFESGQKDEYNQRLVVNPETAGRYHSDWLSMMYPRLKLARNLLKDDGVIFISIDDNEFDNLKKIADEIFGQQNFIASLAVQLNPRGRHLDNFVARTHEAVVIYGKDAFVLSTMTGIEKSGDMESEYNRKDENGPYRILGLRNRNQSFNPQTRPKLYYPLYVNPVDSSVSLSMDNSFTKEVLPITSEGIMTCWTWGKEKVKKENHLLIGSIVNGEWQVFRKDYLYDAEGKKALTLIKSLWTDKEINNDYGKKSIKTLFGNNVMDFPKSPEFIYKLIESGSVYKDSIVLDFFAGSSTTAQAVMQFNANTGNRAKFIMVQLPEEIDNNHTAFKEGYELITELGKERIRRAAKSIVNRQLEELHEKKAKLEKMLHGKLVSAEGQWQFPENVLIDEVAETLLEEINHLQLTINHLDTGFRVYRLDSSNMQDVYYRPQDYKQESMELFADNIKADRTPDDLLAQVMLDWGLPLSLNIEQQQLQGKLLFKVAGNSLYACFDDGIDEAFAKAVAPEHPLRMVFRDIGFSSDTAKVNVKQLLKQLSPETEMKVI
jgi:adenine-specific DNA-methyltransferase